MRKVVKNLTKIAQAMLSVPHLDSKYKKFVSKTLAKANPAATKVSGHEIVVEQARALYARRSDNTIEVDEDAIVLAGEDGCFVQGWLYVPNTTKED